MSLSVFAGTATDAETKVTDALKEHYKPQRIKEMAYKNNPLLGLIPKYESFGGENMPIPIIITGPQRRSATFTDGQNNTSTSNVKQFLLTRVRDYSFATIQHEAIRASQGNADAFVRYATMEIDGAIHSLKRSMATAMYRDGTGAIGRISSNPSGGSAITLVTGGDVVNFEVGMRLACASSTTAAVRANFGGSSQNYVTVTGVNRAASTAQITVTETIHADASANDYLFCLGDAQNGTAIAPKLSGLEAWVPEASPTTALFGAVRTADPTRLGGVRYDGSALPIEEALISGASLVGREGGAPDHVFMDFTSYSNLEKALGSKVQYDKVKSADADVGFDALVVNGPRGRMKIIPDHNCQPNVAWMLQLDTWSLNTLGAAPQILDLDGNNMLRENAADAYEVRVGMYGNIACNAPGWNCRVKLA